MFAFGPVPSRRLGKSLGVNNIPPKICSYGCVYCQLGSTVKKTIERKKFYNSKEVVEEVVKRVKKVGNRKIDYITFVPDGEPTLDINLGKEIKELRKRLDIPVAVITNGSLIFDEKVRNDLKNADLVSLKVDAVKMDVWKKIDRPHRDLKLEEIVEGMKRFSRSFKGKVITETMLVKGLNDEEEEYERIADFLTEVKPETSFLASPTRPPAEKWVKPATEKELIKAYHVFRKKGLKTEYLIEYEGSGFVSTGNVEEDILSITSVHPMREDYIHELIKRRGLKPEKILNKLLRERKIISLKYRNYNFYMRKLPSRH